MNNKEFIEKVIAYVRDGAVEDVICRLLKPPGRKPRKKHLLQSEWYNQLKEEDKKMLVEVIQESVDESIFGLLSVIDGVRIIEEPILNGKLELKYVDSSDEQLLNDPQNEYLHDIYNGLINEE